MQDKPYQIGLDARMYRSSTAGIGRYTRELIKHLAEIDKTNQYTVFLTPKDMPEWSLEQENFKPVVVDIYHYSVSEQTKFLVELNKHKLDLVHFLNFNHPILYRGTFITTLHDLTLYFYPSGRTQESYIRRKLFDLVFRHSLFSAEKVIAISKYTAKDAHEHLGLPTEHINMVYEGGPEPKPLPTNHKKKIQEYLKSTEPYFLFVSQWRPHKGIITLIEAYNQFKKTTGLPHKLVLTGRKDASEAEVMKAWKRSPFKRDILTPGFVPEELLSSLYANAVALTVPSEYEGFGLTPLEAFTYETPVIAANNSSLTEVVGDGGILFPTRDVDALAKHLETIAKTPQLRLELIEKGKKQLTKFSWQRAAKETLATYNEVLG